MKENRKSDSIIRSTTYRDNPELNDALVEAGYTLFVVELADLDLKLTEVKKALEWREQYNN